MKSLKVLCVFFVLALLCSIANSYELLSINNPTNSKSCKLKEKYRKHHWEIYKTKYEYNEDGSIIEYYYPNPGFHGFLLKMNIFYHLFGDSSTKSYKKRIIKNDDIIKIYTCNKNFNKCINTGNFKYEYDSNGNLLKKFYACSSNSDKCTYFNEYKYDRHNNIIEKKQECFVIYANKCLRSEKYKNKYTYDNKGRISKEYKYCYGNINEKCNSIKKYDYYDNNEVENEYMCFNDGNCRLENKYDKNGNIKYKYLTEYTDNYYYKYIYDNNNNVSKINYFSNNEETTIEEIIRDKYGNIILHNRYEQGQKTYTTKYKYECNE